MINPDPEPDHQTQTVHESDQTKQEEKKEAKEVEDDILVKEEQAGEEEALKGPGGSEEKEPSTPTSDVDGDGVTPAKEPDANEGDEIAKLATTVRRDMNRFPEKLMRILDSEEYIAIFSWSKSGKSIVIHQPYELINKVLVKHFDAKEDMKFDSFLRKLYRWGFSKKTADEEDGDDEGAHIYIHNHFQKGKLDECIKVVCTSKPASSRPPSKRGSYNMYYGGSYPSMPYSAQQQPMMMMNGIYQHANMMPQMGMGNFATPADRASMEQLLMSQQERREREMLLLQQQQMAMRNGQSQMMGYGSQLPYNAGSLSSGMGSSGMGSPSMEAARLGDDINRFERRLAGLQPDSSMMPGYNNNAGGFGPSFSNHNDMHRRVMMEAQAGLMRPGSNNMMPSRGQQDVHSKAPGGEGGAMESSGNPGSGGLDNMSLQEKYMMMSQQQNMMMSQQQNNFDNMQNKREITSSSGNQSQDNLNSNKKVKH